MSCRSSSNRSQASSLNQTQFRESKRTKKMQKLRKKVTLLDDYRYIVGIPETNGLNWRIQFVKGQCKFSHWVPVRVGGGEIQHHQQVQVISWFYVDGRGILCVGTRHCRFKCMSTNMYFNPKYGGQTMEEVLLILTEHCLNIAT